MNHRRTVRGVIVAAAMLFAVMTTITTTWWIELTTDQRRRAFDAQIARHDSAPTWVCTIWERPGRTTVNFRAVHTDDEIILHTPSFTTDPNIYPQTQQRMRERTRQSWWTFSRRPTPEDVAGRDLWHNETAVGWPMRAMMHKSLMDGDRRTGQHGFLQERGWAWAVPFGERTVALPLKPIWSGFLLNTLLATVPWLALFILLADPRHSVRAIVRRLGNRCTTCGYDLRAASNSRCPECGTAS